MESTRRDRRRRYRIYAGAYLAAGLAVLLLGIPGGVRAQGSQVEINLYYPPDQAIVEDQYLTVEGMVRAAGVEQFEVQINEETPLKVAVHDRLFAEEVRLEKGMNIIKVGFDARRVFVLTAGGSAPTGFSRISGHRGLDNGCLECHKIDREGRFVLAGEPEEICGWCHGDLVRSRGGKAWASVHDPVAEGKCLLCHGPHLSDKPGLPAKNPAACATCHGAVFERLKTDRFVHGPMNLGDCRLCHTLHSSPEPGLLVRPAVALCTDCHSEVLPAADKPSTLKPHNMIPQGQCSRCHDAHSSPNPRMLRQPAGRLCLECHAEKTRSFHEAKGFSIYICSKCHDLHRPTQPHLIIDASRSLCLDCHDFRGEKMAFTHSFVRDGGCFLCHTFHEAPLPGDVATTCLQCHRDNPRLPAAHCGVPFERSRCTSCHLPHQSRRPKLLRAEEHTPFAKRTCDPCHRERADKIGAAFRPLCLDCHKNLDLKALQPPPANVHPPFLEQDCSGCHGSHNSEFKGILAASGVRLCLDCHRKLKKSTILTPRSSHRDFLEGGCHSCHDPHFSPQDALLKKPQNVLCIGCHRELVEGPAEKLWAVRHAPVEQRKCRLCHRPHSSMNPSLLKSPSPQPCRPCHQTFFAAVESAANRSRHAPFSEGKCGVCHRLHGGADAALLRPGGKREVCRECHPELKSAHHQFAVADLEAKEGGAKAGERGCLHCHSPHVAEQRHLLPSSRDSVCQGCHKT